MSCASCFIFDAITANEQKSQLKTPEIRLENALMETHHIFNRTIAANSITAAARKPR